MSVSTFRRIAFGLLGFPMTNEHITVKRHRLEHVDVYEVFGDELDRIEQEAATIGTDLQFALFWLPIAVTLTATLILTNIPNERVHTGFLIFTIMSYGFGVYFVIRWLRQIGSFKRLLSKIRDRQVGPIGEEGKEIKDVTELSSGEPSADKRGSTT